jgi:uncharacterized protein (TIGR02246 family)
VELEEFVFRHRLVVLLVVLVAAVSAAESPSSSSRNDEESIKAVIAATTEAFSRRDAKTWVKFCTPDAQLVTVRGESMKGVAAIEKGLTTIDVAVRFIRPDVALAHVTNELSGLVNPEGQTLPPHQELSIRVFVKDQDVWRITAFHNTMLQK